MNLPERTIERLSEYRRSLLNWLSTGKSYIFSHELAGLHNITPVQVRRDIMLIGYSSVKKKGYDAKELIALIGRIIDSEKGLNIAVLGMGNLGKAVTAYFNGKRSKMQIVATFDNDLNKIGRVIADVNCYHINDLAKIVTEKNISIGIITTPPQTATRMGDRLVEAGIKGIMNFTTSPLNVDDSVYLEEYGMITSLEKVAYFVKKHSGQDK